MKILVVDDSIVYRTAIKTSLANNSDIKEIKTASHGKIAVDMLKLEHFDAMTLDLEMPVMDGVESIKAIREFNKDIPIIIFSAQNINAANKTLKALEMGANDFVQKIEGSGDLNANLKMIESELVPKFKAFLNKLRSTQSSFETLIQKPSAVSKRSDTSYRRNFYPDLICIGSSTGGPETLKTIFKGLKPNISKPFLLVQHMPPIFTTQLAEALSKCSDLTVSEAKHGDILKSGHCYIAPGDYHMSLHKVNNEYCLHLDQTEKICYVRPAVDVMLNSVVDNFTGKIATFILTGMGNDGSNGCKYLKEKHKGVVVIQDEKSSVVFGMPKAVYELDIYDEMAPLSEISQIINDIT